MSLRRSHVPIQELISLELTSLCPRQLRPQTWKFRSGKSTTSIFPSTPKSIQHLRYFNHSSPLLTENHLRILRKRRMLPHFPSRYHHSIHSQTLPRTKNPLKDRVLWKYKTIKKPPLSHCLNKILKEAKNLKSLLVESGDRINNFKVIRKARNLQNLEFMIKTSQIMQYPQLFRNLTSLQKVTLYVKGSQRNLLVDKFFVFLINLPRLQHLTVWFDEGGDYFKTLLLALHIIELPSFHIIASNPEISKGHINWGKCIETLYIGPIPSLENRAKSHAWLPAQNQEKRLRINLVPEKDDLVSTNNSIKTLEIVNFLYLEVTSHDPNADKALFEFISQVKSLENLTLAFEETLPIANTTYDDFNRKFAQIDSLENLKKLSFSLAKKEKKAGKRISAPYGNQMKNLKTLCLNITACHFDFSGFMEGLKDLANLENFNFKYKDTGKNDFSLDCNFPFEALKNLKSIDLNCNIQFSTSSMDQLVDSISQLENLESLKIEGEIFDGLTRKKASALIGDLYLKVKLEVASFYWRETEISRWNQVSKRRVNGEMIISSGRKV